MIKFVSFSGDNQMGFEKKVNTWLTEHPNIEIISTNVFTGSDRYPDVYMILYKEV